MANGSNLVGGRLRPQATRRARSARSGSDFGWRLGQSDRNGRRLAQRMLGWHRTTERILPHAIRQKFTVGADGELEPFTEGSSKPMSVVVTNADTVLEQFDRRTPWFMAPGTNAGSVPALAFFSKLPGTGSVAQKPPWTLLYHWPRNECPISAWFVWRWDTTGNGSDRQTVLRASSDDWRPLSFYTFRYDWLLRGGQRTFSPFHRRIVATYALEIGAAGDGDNRDHSFSTLRAARYLIHDVLPIFQSPISDKNFCSHRRPSLRNS